MLDYPAPERIKTKRRCQFSMPNRHYDCRKMGKYVLDDKGYCAPHYDTAWKVKNPVYGQQHVWHFRANKYTKKSDAYESCAHCGTIRVHEGLPQAPCKGKFDQIALR